MPETKKITSMGIGVIVAMLLLTYSYIEIVEAPSGFPVSKNFIVDEHESLKSISNRLKDQGYISSALFFRAGISFFGKDKQIKVGGYTFDAPKSLLEIINTFALGKPNTPLLSVTVPEGSTSVEVAAIVSKVLPSISVDSFNKRITEFEANGKLFPSTYFLLPSYKEEDIIRLMLSTFVKKFNPIFTNSKITSPLTGENDVIILASILEGEAKTEEDMKIIAGILLTRLQIGMPLQVDVAKETYKQKGLPVSPINNPGLTAIISVLNPTQTDYLYYITGNDGKMYYAKDFDEHRINIKKYLK